MNGLLKARRIWNNDLRILSNPVKYPCVLMQRARIRSLLLDRNLSNLRQLLSQLNDIRHALNEITSLKLQRDRLQRRELSLSSKIALLQKANHNLKRQTATSKQSARQGASESQLRMLGMLRRLKYLTQQMKQRENQIHQVTWNETLRALFNVLQWNWSQF